MEFCIAGYFNNGQMVDGTFITYRDNEDDYIINVSKNNECVSTKYFESGF